MVILFAVMSTLIFWNVDITEVTNTNYQIRIALVDVSVCVLAPRLVEFKLKYARTCLPTRSD